MITIYTGVPGSGKSAHLSADCIKWLKNGQYVLANFDYDSSPWDDHFIRIPDYPDAKEVLQIIRDLPRDRVEHNAIVCIDEAQRCFSNRTWNEKGRMPWIKFFTLSRHVGADVVLVAQSAGMVDKQIRAVIQTEVRHMRVAAMGAVPFVLSGFGLLPLVFWAESYSGTRVRVASGFFLPRKKYWSRYDSYDVSFLEEFGVS